MRRNVTLGFSEAEYLPIQGAAAVARMPVATYLKWLLQSGDGKRETSVVLARLDELCAAVAKLGTVKSTAAVAMPVAAASVTSSLSVPRELLATRLRDRGIPSTIIRQLTTVLDDIEAGK